MKPGQQLQIILDEVAPLLKRITDSDAKLQPSGKWSKIQILGHTIDSGLNNIGRFIRAQQTEDLLFQGYDQIFWVDTQQWQKRDWKEVLTLFLSINSQIAFMADHIPKDILTKPRLNHSMSWPLYASKNEEAPYNLEFLILDYIGHLENHLKQIITDYQPKVLRT